MERLPGGFRGEILGGEIVEKTAASPRHSLAQLMLSGSVMPFVRRTGGGGPGGWWLLTEAEVEYEPHELFVHDLAGWRREAVDTPPGSRPTDPPTAPTQRPIRVRPDWVCEILCPSNPSNWKTDTVDKLQVLLRHGVPYYWIVDLEHEVLTVYRLGNGTYEIAAQAQPGERRRLASFEALELEVTVLLGGDAEEAGEVT